MKSKIYLLGLIILVFTVCLFWFSLEKKTTFLISMANPSEVIDLLVKMDDQIIFNDTLLYHPYELVIVKKNFKGGVYKLLVSSNKANLKEERYIIILSKRVLASRFIIVNVCCPASRYLL